MVVNNLSYLCKCHSLVYLPHNQHDQFSSLASRANSALFSVRSQRVSVARSCDRHNNNNSPGKRTLLPPEQSSLGPGPRESAAGKKKINITKGSSPRLDRYQNIKATRHQNNKATRHQNIKATHQNNKATHKNNKATRHQNNKAASEGSTASPGTRPPPPPLPPAKLRFTQP